MTPTSKDCDHGNHVACAAAGGVALYVEQDGLQRYECKCFCHRFAVVRCYQCDDEIVRDRFGKWSHTHGHPANGHLAAAGSATPTEDT